jgi:hypothetical protein
MAPASVAIEAADAVLRKSLRVSPLSFFSFIVRLL